MRILQFIDKFWQLLLSDELFEDDNDIFDSLGVCFATQKLKNLALEAVVSLDRAVAHECQPVVAKSVLTNQIRACQTGKYDDQKLHFTATFCHIFSTIFCFLCTVVGSATGAPN